MLGILDEFKRRVEHLGYKVVKLSLNALNHDVDTSGVSIMIKANGASSVRTLSMNGGIGVSGIGASGNGGHIEMDSPMRIIDGSVGLSQPGSLTARLMGTRTGLRSQTRAAMGASKQLQLVELDNEGRLINTPLLPGGNPQVGHPSSDHISGDRPGTRSASRRLPLQQSTGANDAQRGVQGGEAYADGGESSVEIVEPRVRRHRRPGRPNANNLRYGYNDGNYPPGSIIYRDANGQFLASQPTDLTGMGDNSAGSERRFPCSSCTALFRTADERSNHEYRIHGTSIRHGRRIEQDAQGNKRRRVLRNNMRSPMVCSKCGLVLANQSILTLHLSQEHEIGVPTLKCGYCGGMFFNNMQLQNHMTLHSSGESLTCTECFLEFPDNGSLIRHYVELHKDVI